MSAPPSLRLFGVPTLGLAAGGEHVFAADRPHQLLALLACRGDWTSRAELAEWLWSERTSAAALSNLRKVLLRAQRVIEDCGAAPVELRPGLLRWAPESDLRRFERACEEQRPADALAAWGGELLQAMDAGLSGGAIEWLDFERARLAARWRAAASARLAQLGDEPGEAAALAARLLHADPFDEAALASLVHARLQAGQAALALQELQAHGERVRAQFGVDPPAPLRALAERARLSAAGPGPAPAATTPAATTPARPAAAAPPADFVGRRLELLQLRDWLLHERRPVVSLTGPGGAGKTRLARALLSQLAAEGFDRAWWVALSDLQDAAALPLRLAAALGLPATGTAAAEPWAPIVRHLAAAPALLMLDNGEQIEALPAALARLLHDCPGLQLLNVSRRRLQIDGEWLLPLEGLPLPDIDEEDPELLARNDAVAMFTRRAKAVSPAFELAPQAAAVVRFVHAVEGLPLAIEIGAALARLLPVHEIEAAFAAAPGAAPSLDAGFELSWQGLAEPERQALHALACLPADVDRNWAEQMARAPLPVLSSLVDRSLVRADGQGRFGLHPLLRRWAAARIDDAAARAALLDRHAACVAHTLEQLGRQGGAAPERLVGTLRTEWSHVAAAWRHAVATQQSGFIVRAAPVLQSFFEFHGAWSDGLAMFEAALGAFGQPGQGEPARAHMHLLRSLASLQVRYGRHAEAEAHARQAFRLALRLGERSIASAGLTTLGLSLFSRGHYTQAKPIFEHALRVSRTLPETVRLDVSLGNLAIAELALGRFEAARTLFEELIPRSRRRGEVGGLIVYLGNVGEVHRGLGDWRAALAANEEALALCERHGVRSRRVTKLLNMGTVHHAMGQLELAAARLDGALAEARESGDRSNEVAALLARSALRIDLAQPVPARADLLAALDLGTTLESADIDLRCALALGEWLLAAATSEAGREIARGWIGWALAQPALYAVERAMALHRLARRGLEAAVLATAPAPAAPPGLAAGASTRDAALAVGRQLRA